MAHTFRPAKRKNRGLLIGIGGASWSGKTLSALRVAIGLAGDDPSKVFMLDTESGRGEDYDYLGYMYGELGPPFTPDRYLQALQDARAQGARVIVTDSSSHQHQGRGGVLDWHEAELQRLINGDNNKRDRLTFAAWARPKASYNNFISEILRFGDVHLIFCFRAKEKLRLIKKSDGKSEMVEIGWQPICTDGFEYEMTDLLMLPPNSRGCPDLSIESTKIHQQHWPIFGDGEQLTEETGRMLADWAAGTEDPSEELLATARGHAAQGREAFLRFWQNLDKKARRPLRRFLGELEQAALAADNASGGSAPAAQDDSPQRAAEPQESVSGAVESTSKDVSTETSGAGKSAAAEAPPSSGQSELGLAGPSDEPPDDWKIFADEAVAAAARARHTAELTVWQEQHRDTLDELRDKRPDMAAVVDQAFEQADVRLRRR